VPQPTPDKFQTVIGSAVTSMRLGVVSYLNSRPLYEPLTKNTAVNLTPDVPAKLIDGLLHNDVDAALIPVVDYFRHRDLLRPLSDACIACDGETMTVRVFSRIPAERITTLHADLDSHTSVILVQLLWRELYGRELKLEPWSIDDAQQFDDVEAVLLIGDKVVSSDPTGFGFEVDLGAAWKHLTGLPFVFAAWYGKQDMPRADEVARQLSQARDEGVVQAEALADRYAALHGWPVELARKYLCRTLRYTLTPPARTGMERFFAMATAAGLLP